MDSATNLQILMATYNGEKYIAEQIDSIRCQTYTNWSLLISDDCSSDGTLELLRKYESLDPRIEIISSDRRFGSARDNFLFLLDKAFADYVMFSDQDDVWDPDKIERTLAKVKELENLYTSDEPIFIFSDTRIVDEKLEVMCESGMEYGRQDITRIYPKQLAVQNLASGCTCLINKSLLKVYQKALKPDGMFMHDWWLIQIASVFGKIGYIPSATMSYRQHGNNSVGVGQRAKVFYFPSFQAPSEEPGELINAKAFYEAFGAQMDESSAKVFRELALVGTDKGKGLAHLIRSGAWKHGFVNKLHQIHYALTQKWI